MLAARADSVQPTRIVWEARLTRSSLSRRCRCPGVQSYNIVMNGFVFSATENLGICSLLKTGVALMLSRKESGQTLGGVWP
jgi:hypothetical protein